MSKSQIKLNNSAMSVLDKTSSSSCCWHFYDVLVIVLIGIFKNSADFNFMLIKNISWNKIIIYYKSMSIFK